MENTNDIDWNAESKRVQEATQKWLEKIGLSPRKVESIEE